MIAVYFENYKGHLNSISRKNSEFLLSNLAVAL